MIGIFFVVTQLKIEIIFSLMTGQIQDKKWGELYFAQKVSNDFSDQIYPTNFGVINMKKSTCQNFPFLARLHFSAEELLLYPRRRRQRQRPCRRPRPRPQNVRANVKVLEF